MEGTQMVMAKEDIESIKAALVAAKDVVDLVTEVMKDGKVDFKDITALPGVFSAVKAIAESAKGVGPEFKDLDAEEIKEVLALTVDLLLYIGKKVGIEV